MIQALITKYNTPVPRYTSYPTVPFWENQMDGVSWMELVKKAFQLHGQEDGITLYIHFPFCESLCTYCGCTKYITRNHNVEENYVRSLLIEWKKYLETFGQKPKLKGIHLGGGTPTFFSPESLYVLLSQIQQDCEIGKDKEFSFEGHPNNTTRQHLRVLANLGFDRVSFGIQDFDSKVQEAIHRIQPFEKVQEVTRTARELGFTSINFDLIYGLPHQSQETLARTFEKVMELKPERIAFYSYAHLPSLFKAQRSFEKYLPAEHEKRELYEFGKKKLLAYGYEEVGMDHFALPEDPLCEAKKSGRLHRNFMGYTTFPGKIMIGLGASSISDVYLGFAQNEKNHKLYNEAIQTDQPIIRRNHSNTALDLITRDLILDLICRHEAVIPDEIWDQIPTLNRKNLREMEQEGLIQWNGKKLTVSELGVTFIRNICFQFDLKMVEKSDVQTKFSRSI
ncbi:oxygen-independent coproporphyrinogen III oxidase [Algoriphagus namhaensis]